jgi:hypothetical protein
MIELFIEASKELQVLILFGIVYGVYSLIKEDR